LNRPLVRSSDRPISASDFRFSIFNSMTHGAQRNVGSLATAQRVGRHSASDRRSDE
jgi:hypothetical protein